MGGIDTLAADDFGFENGWEAQRRAPTGSAKPQAVEFALQAPSYFGLAGATDVRVFYAPLLRDVYHHIEGRLLGYRIPRRYGAVHEILVAAL